MRATDVLAIIAIGVVTTVIGNYVWKRLNANGPATILPFSKASGDCGCGG